MRTFSLDCLEFTFSGDEFICLFSTNKLNWCAERIKKLSEGSSFKIVIGVFFITFTCTKV